MESLIPLLLGWLLRFARPMLSALAVLLSPVTNAQLFSSAATITINAGAVVDVNGDLHNHSTGELLNDGFIVLSGDLTNDAANTGFGGSAGTVVLDGGIQRIGGASNIVFNDLVLAGNGLKILQRDIEVGGLQSPPLGVLELNDQVLDLNSHVLTMRMGHVDAIQRSTGFIVSETDPLAGYGTLRWNIGQQAVGGNTFVFPFGNAASGNYLPVGVNITDPGMGVSGWLALSTYPTDVTASPNNRPLPAGLAVLTDVNGMENAPNVLDRFWIMEAGGYANAPTAIASFSYRDPEWSTGTNTIVEGTLQLERLENAQWQMLPSVIDISANSLVAGGQPLTSSIWTAASIGSPLPVELLGFTGERTRPREVMLRWSTASENNNAGFKVWRMIEGEEEFTALGWVDGVGDTQQLTTYAFPDDNPIDRTSYYRLEQVDFDGSHHWSPVVAVNGNSISTPLIAFPNPARDRLMLSGLPPGTTRIDLFDTSGRVVRSWNNTVALDDLGALERGVYMVGVTGVDGMKSVRVVLE